MERDLAKIRQLAEEKRDENWKFRSFLKGFCRLSLEKVDRLAHKLYREISSVIDCGECGNCCREIKPVLNRSDIERLAKGLNISATQFKEQHLIRCNEGDGFWFKTKPCPFLSGKRCSQYHYRPTVCQSFPHLHKKDFVFRLINVIDNYSICPIVFNVYERLKSELWYRKAETTMADEEYNHLWDLTETANGNLPHDDNAFEEKFAEWKQRDWMRWLQDNLSFPFMTERVEDDDDAYFNPAAALKPFTLGHKMKALVIVNEDDLYGIIVKVREGKKVGHVPLCDLKVISQADKNYWPVREYSVWFANK